MSFRGLILATQFLSRLPVPAIREVSHEDVAQSTAWFPFVGVVIGGLVAAVVFVCGLRSPLLAGAVGVLVWVGLTGALHLDGLADLSDALGAAHGDSERFLAVLRDPHKGTFGVVSVVVVLILKFAALTTLAGPPIAALPLIFAWARLGALAWGRWLSPLKAGRGESFGLSCKVGWIVFWSVALLLLSAAVAPALCVAPLAIAAWGIWLRIRVGGMTGDCLGAGVEVTEAALLLVVALISDEVPALL